MSFARVFLVALMGAMASAQTVEPGAPPQPLSARGLDNLRALARLFGYVRYFHPTYASATAEWDQFAVAGVRSVESARNAAELAVRLESTSGSPPTFRVFPTGSTPPSLHFDPAPNLIEWRHNGVGFSENSPYYSERVTRPSRGVADEIEIFRADLPGGVSCLIPRVLYTSQRGVFRLKPSSGNAPGSGDDRAVRLAAVIVAWNVLQHFYPYFDVVQSDWPQALTVFLTDGRAISFSETIMAIVENSRLGTIVGGPTAGTNGNINPFTVPGGYRISWTGMKVTKHDGSTHHGVGIAPDVPVSRTRGGVAAGRDEVLDRALELLGEAGG